ncbi:M28 family peptidase [Pontibacter toksunensis]|uniref:M28 family peptidase n=1 Tax=Pontibacter toksunensis TaxID=1332631 RepID=A0ABW6BYT7_9BACT
MRKLFLLLCFLPFANLSFATVPVAADTLQLKRHLKAITSTPEARNYRNLSALNQVADYIKTEFSALQGQVTEQVYKVDGNDYRNIILSTGPKTAPVLVIGAHYDVYGDQQGADDNASGVAGLLELARLLQQHKLPFRVDFVAYTLEEPPYFRTENMGSYIHAQSLKKAQTDVLGMVSLEMIGYFSDAENSQRYPLAPMKLKYGTRANFISVVQRFGNGDFGDRFLRNFKRKAALPVKSLKAPASVPGVDFSDHLNYWHFGYNALMITDTSFYRNNNYHKKTDTLATLDIARMAQVIAGVYQTVLALSN